MFGSQRFESHFAKQRAARPAPITARKFGVQTVGRGQLNERVDTVGIEQTRESGFVTIDTGGVERGIEVVVFEFTDHIQGAGAEAVQLLQTIAIEFIELVIEPGIVGLNQGVFDTTVSKYPGNGQGQVVIVAGLYGNESGQFGHIMTPVGFGQRTAFYPWRAHGRSAAQYRWWHGQVPLRQYLASGQSRVRSRAVARARGACFSVWQVNCVVAGKGSRFPPLAVRVECR